MKVLTQATRSEIFEQSAALGPNALAQILNTFCLRRINRTNLELVY